jgi:modulator of FtsH protease
MSLFSEHNSKPTVTVASFGNSNTMDESPEMFSSGAVSSTEVNKLIRNTYILLSLTLMFTAVTAGMSMMLKLPHPGLILTLVGYFGLLFLTNMLRNSVWGIAAIFALTGFMGLTLGPIISAYLTMFSNGAQLVMMAFGSTAAIFLSLSAYALTTRKDFSFMGAFLMTGILVAFLAGLGAVIFQIPGLALAVSAMFVLLMSGLILYQTSDMVHGRETNYIMATVTLYVSIYNLFTSLLQIFGVLGGEE